jgi:hypothetical protein
VQSPGDSCRISDWLLNSCIPSDLIGPILQHYFIAVTSSTGMGVLQLDAGDCYRYWVQFCSFLTSLFPTLFVFNYWDSISWAHLSPHQPKKAKKKLKFWLQHCLCDALVLLPLRIASFQPGMLATWGPRACFSDSLSSDSGALLSNTL